MAEQQHSLPEVLNDLLPEAELADLAQRIRSKWTEAVSATKSQNPLFLSLLSLHQIQDHRKNKK